MAYRRLADMPWLGRALGGRGEPFETPFAGGVAGGIEGREALRRWRVFIGNFVLHVEHTGTGEQKMDKHTEQTNPMSTMFLWQKQAARKSTLSWRGTAMICRMEGGGRNDIVRYCKKASRRSRYIYDPPVRCAAC
jgi:hypothetical protein